jgi:hypothetical protein
VRQDRDPDSYPSATSGRPFTKEKVGWEREGVNYRKSRDGYWDSSSDHVNYDGLAAASPSTSDSECWHALLSEPPCLDPAEKDLS